MHSVRVLSQPLVSALFIAVPTNTENLKIFLHFNILTVLHAPCFLGQYDTLPCVFIVAIEMIPSFSVCCKCVHVTGPKM